MRQVAISRLNGSDRLEKRLQFRFAALAPGREERPTGWFVVNVVGPLLLPVFGILLFSLVPFPPPTSVHAMAMVKDGQLCWAVIAMGASTMYEWWDAVEAHRNLPAWGGAAITGTLLVMLSAILVAAGGAVFSKPLRPKPPPVRGLVAWIAYYKMFVGSAIMSLIAAFLYTNIHFSLLP